MEVGYRVFAHPAYAVSTFEGFIAPIFLIGCAMFPFVIQMNEVVAERELRLRQALAAMGLRDTAYWLSWHLYQSVMALLFGFFIWAFGCIFQFRLFLKNDFGVVLLTFWLFGQSMVGLAFLVGAFLYRSAYAVGIGFGIFLVGFVLFFMISLAGFPYGGPTVVPFSYSANITTGNLTRKSGNDVVWAPLLAFLPPSLLIKDIADMGAATAADSAKGIRFADSYGYCTLEAGCDPDFSVGKSWGWFIGLYLLYSVLGLYFENVLPDAMGVKKSPWYFLLPSYWGVGHVQIIDRVEVIEASTDEDVLAEEQLVQARQNRPMGGSSAIEIRGLCATFKRGGRALHAVKCPWYRVGKRQLFALIGPNGAGKTTIINMLTGFLPPAGGNALVFGETVAHSSGMDKIRRLMGVCPQFDILWSMLSAKEHLELFGTIKGIKVDSLGAEADKRIEEVRLTESAHQSAGALSGGMKRRLSVAVALVGSPEVVYLDEPTTGMDPINRRHVWDVIEAAKQDRSVVLTTHSMEEADILGDRIGIMAKGRLRCLGTSVRLKTRFGEGYKVSVSCGDNMGPDSRSCQAVKTLFREWFQTEVNEETKAYMHFGVPAAGDAKMVAFFTGVEEQREALGITDMQLSMSSLEDVFLRVVTESELEEARNNNKTTAVTLSTGESVDIPLGYKSNITSERGVTFNVRWGTDEDGGLTPEEIKEVVMVQQEVSAKCPAGMKAGQIVPVMFDGAVYQATVQADVATGEQFTAVIQVPQKEAAETGSDERVVTAEFSQEAIRERVDNLRTPFMWQANALLRKNLAFQWKRRGTNCCLVLVPLLVLLLVFGAQALLETLFLGSSNVRCPYCGPADDDWGKLYRNKASSCVEFFFPNSSRSDYQAPFKTDVVLQCMVIAGEGPLGKNDPNYCYGDGNVSCYQPQWSVAGQVQYCPYRAGTIQNSPQLGLTPTPITRAAQPVLVTSDVSSQTFARTLGNHTAPSHDDIHAKVAGARREMNHQLFTLLTGVPGAGCSRASGIAAKLPALCKLLQVSSPLDPCCLDLTGIDPFLNVSYQGLAAWKTSGFAGSLRAGVNYWSDMPEAHNDTAYNWTFQACTALGGTVGACNAEVMSAWEAVAVPAGRFGVRFGTGRGKFLAGPLGLGGLVFSQGTTAQFRGKMMADFSLHAEESFWCVAPAFAAGSTSALRLSDDKCVNLEEALATLAQAERFPTTLHPIYEQELATVPDCTANGTCTFKGISDPVIGTFYADTPGRWAQMCDFYTTGMPAALAQLQQQCDAEKASSGSTAACPTANAQLSTYLSKVPCLCSWLVTMKTVMVATMLPVAQAAVSVSRMPVPYSCPTNAAGGWRDCSPRDPTTEWQPAALPQQQLWMEQYNSFSIEELRLLTSLWPGTNFYSEGSFTADQTDWWNRAHVLSKEEADMIASQNSDAAEALPCNQTGDCWLQAARQRGRFSLLALDCAAIAEEMCFLKRVGNMSNLRVECVSAAPRFLPSADALNRDLYRGQYGQAGSGLATEYVAAYDLHNSAPGLLNVTVMYNDTTQVSSGFGPPRWIRLSQPLNAAIDAFLSLVSGAAGRIYASLMAIKEMPKIASFLSIDFGSILGPFFFTLAWNILFPTIVVSLVYEKEVAATAVCPNNKMHFHHPPPFSSLNSIACTTLFICPFVA